MLDYDRLTKHIIHKNTGSPALSMKKNTQTVKGGEDLGSDIFIDIFTDRQQHCIKHKTYAPGFILPFFIPFF